ncbi:MAG TPA: HAD family phosphatase [Acidimicrobiales bacterium]|nr:HAD family phosphatase [Acidimicrobiales bacterium]
MEQGNVRGRRFDLVIFDNDGVVVDSEHLAGQAMSETLALSGCKLSPGECEELFQGGTLARDRQLVAERFSLVLPNDFEQSYTARLRALMASSLRAVEGVAAVLDALELAGMPYCLASSGRRERVLFSLQAAGIASRFAERWWGAEDVSEGKPSPELFLLAAKSMGAVPRRCVVVEDAELGVLAAHAAGMTAYGYAARTPQEKLKTADVIFTDMEDLPALLLQVQA